jgi:ribonuclease HII
MPPDLLHHERLAWAADRLLVGIDEVGRGPLAGPVVAAAVVFALDHAGIEGVRDSKVIARRAERTGLAHRIRSEALAFGLGAASVREIGHLNIRRATAVAMRRALTRCLARLRQARDVEVWVDGRPVPELAHPHQALVKGDAHCHAIAAAAILAKVVRDDLMTRLAIRRPGYGWESNAGYGSSGHLAALRRDGLTPHHRVQFCETALGQRELGLG